MANTRSGSRLPLLWQAAAAYSARSHHHDYRDDDKTPYFSHPARVALTVSLLFGCQDDAAVIAALLHDVLENTREGYDDLKERFGDQVADLVVALTKNKLLPLAEQEQDFEQRIANADWRARLVKLADVYDNFSDVLAGEKDESRREMKQKCRHAIALAESDAAVRTPTRRAIKVLKRLLRKGGR